MFAGTPWLQFETRAGSAVINADTTRAAVQRMVTASRGGKRWWVIDNARGRVNKIVFDLEDSHEGWYAYLREPLTQRTEL